MKALAICFSGSLRSLEYCFENFIEKIFNPNKNYFVIKLFYYIPNDINHMKINIANNFNPIVKMENDKAMPDINIIWNGRSSNNKVNDNVSSAGIYGYLQQLYGIQESYKLVENYEKENNINFDIILRVRTDVIFKNELDLQKYNIDKLYIPTFHGYSGINDRFAFGLKKHMTSYMHMYDNIYKMAAIEQLNLSQAEVFCMINLMYHNVPYELRNEIKFNRVRMNGEILKDY